MTDPAKRPPDPEPAFQHRPQPDDPGQDCPARRHERDGRAAAEELQAQRPQWIIMYGCYTHQFVAWPKFAVTRRVIISVYYPDALIDRLDRAERAYRIHPPNNSPGTEQSQH